MAVQDWCWVQPGDTPDELWRRDLAPMGLRLLATVLDALTAGMIPRWPQPDHSATWEPAFKASRLARK